MKDFYQYCGEASSLDADIVSRDQQAAGGVDNEVGVAPRVSGIDNTKGVLGFKFYLHIGSVTPEVCFPVKRVNALVLTQETMKGEHGMKVVNRLHFFEQSQWLGKEASLDVTKLGERSVFCVNSA